MVSAALCTGTPSAAFAALFSSVAATLPPAWSTIGSSTVTAMATTGFSAGTKPMKDDMNLSSE